MVGADVEEGSLLESVPQKFLVLFIPDGRIGFELGGALLDVVLSQ